MKTKTHILIVDDDVRLRSLLKKYLEKEGFYITTAGNVPEAKRALAFFQCDLIIADIMMPGERGTHLLGHQNMPPILFLSAMGEAEDRIHALEKGGEDYLVKPFEPKELVLRINNILKRQQKILSFGGITYDIPSKKLFCEGQPLLLSPSEAELFHHFASQPNILLTRDYLVSALQQVSSNPRTIDVAVNRLRKKLEDLGMIKGTLQAVRGQGYILRPS